MIQHVYEKVAACLEAAYVATDDERIFKAVEAFGGKAVMTRNDHKSGTDRIEEAIEKIGGDWDVIVNIQGDEPFVAKSQLETICQCFDDPTSSANIEMEREKANAAKANAKPGSMAAKANLVKEFSEKNNRK